MKRLAPLAICLLVLAGCAVVATTPGVPDSAIFRDQTSRDISGYTGAVRPIREPITLRYRPTDTTRTMMTVVAQGIVAFFALRFFASNVVPDHF